MPHPKLELQFAPPPPKVVAYSVPATSIKLEAGEVPSLVPIKLYAACSTPVFVDVNTVPFPVSPPFGVVPYRVPLIASKPACGNSPSCDPAKLYNNFSVPLSPTSKIAPSPLAVAVPPCEVVP